ncbi:hypothetical protein PoB_005079300 [Plakobranchus ocellatus]|uniref:Uncharacterized protein n=1 Tax=Plakobranchus ocellatus TaxID=259542 RepID=A0AAV4BYI3_9GAST|nr:hypothetical protein PoB_005079300 [Plakobranchus ocellatus]
MLTDSAADRVFGLISDSTGCPLTNRDIFHPRIFFTVFRPGPSCFSSLVRHQRRIDLGVFSTNDRQYPTNRVMCASSRHYRWNPMESLGIPRKPFGGITNQRAFEGFLGIPGDS